MPAAQMRTFEYEGQTLHCLVFVSSCIVCGHRWKDEIHEAVNSHQVEMARAGANSRQQPAHDTRAFLHGTNGPRSSNRDGQQGSADSRRANDCADRACSQPAGLE